MTITDEMLMAYADNELDATATAQVAAEIASDPMMAQRVAQLRSQRRWLQAAFDGVLREPVPPRLVAAAMGLRGIRPARRWGWPEFTGMAASLVVGVVAAWIGLRATDEPTMIVTAEGLVARGALARSLSEELAGETSDGEFRVALSFRDRSGAYCRTFVTAEAAGIVGLACRKANDWRVTLVTNAAPGTGATGYRMAAGVFPPEVLRAVQDRIAGEPLDAEGEKTARARGWVD